MLKKIFLFLIFLFLIFIALNGCSKNETATEPVATPTNTPAPGTISGVLSGLPANIAPYTVFVDNDLNKANGTITEVSGTYSSGNGTQPYSVTVTGGTYYVYAFLDLNYNGIPEPLEYFGVYGATYPAYPGAPNVSVNGGIITADITMVSATANCYGTITLPADGAGNTYTIIADLDGDGNTTDDFITMVSSTVSGTSLPYLILIPFPCSFYIYCVVDMDGSGGSPNTGDFVGIYGGFPGTPITITDLSVLNGPYNFSLTVY